MDTSRIGRLARNHKGHIAYRGVIPFISQIHSARSLTLLNISVWRKSSFTWATPQNQHSLIRMLAMYLAQVPCTSTGCSGWSCGLSRDSLVRLHSISNGTFDAA
eukprot:6467374-Amphidinium_carterae.2